MHIYIFFFNSKNENFYNINFFQRLSLESYQLSALINNFHLLSLTLIEKVRIFKLHLHDRCNAPTQIGDISMPIFCHHKLYLVLSAQQLQYLIMGANMIPYVHKLFPLNNLESFLYNLMCSSLIIPPTILLFLAFISQLIMMKKIIPSYVILIFFLKVRFSIQSKSPNSVQEQNPDRISISQIGPIINSPCPICQLL